LVIWPLIGYQVIDWTIARAYAIAVIYGRESAPGIGI
jgi:hypothetical protein